MANDFSPAKRFAGEEIHSLSLPLFLSAGAADVRRVEPVLREDEAAVVPRALPLPLPHPPRRHTRMPQTQVSNKLSKRR